MSSRVVLLRSTLSARGARVVCPTWYPAVHIRRIGRGVGAATYVVRRGAALVHRRGELGMAPNAVRVIILTTFALDEYVFEAIRAGASGFLVKDTEPRT